MGKMQFVGVAAAAVAAVGMAMTVSTDSEAAGTLKRSGVAGTYGILIGTQTVGFASSVAGGGLNATLTFDKTGSQGSYPKKRFVAGAPDEIVVSVGSADKPLIDWVKGTVNTAKPEKKDGAIVAFSPDFKEISRTSWQRGAIVEIDFPELDAAAARKAWQIELTIAPEVTSFAIGGGAANPAISAQKSKAGALTSSNFRMAMPGLDLKRILSIEEIEVRYRPPPPGAEVPAVSRSAPSSPVDISNLAFVLPESEAAQLYAWHQAMTKSPDANKKTAVIELLGQNLQPTATKLTLNGVGILRVGPLPSATGSEQMRKVRAECFVESMQLDM
jgi:hypothetical protein